MTSVSQFCEGARVAVQECPDQSRDRAARFLLSSGPMIATDGLRRESLRLQLLCVGLAWFAMSCSGSSPGNPGTGGSGGAPADGGGLDGPSCLNGIESLVEAEASGRVGPLDTMSKTTRPAFGWTFVGPLVSGVADAGAPDGGPPPDASGPARCATVPGPTVPYPMDGVRCQGIATLRARTTGPEIAFADGNALVWDGALPDVYAPFVTGTMGDTVWVDYERRTTSVCPFCGAYTTRTLQIRDGEGEGGKVRLFTQNGVVLPPISSAQAMDIFGVTAETVPTCSFRAAAGCYTFVRTHNDHILNTTPPVTIAHAEWRGHPVLPTPNGGYRVFWASSTESDKQRDPMCADGPGIATDNGFTAVLTKP